MDFLGGLFTVLIIFVIGFWLLALLVPTFLRFWIGRKVDAFQRQFNQEMKEEQRNTQQRYYNSSTNYTGQTGHSQQSKQSKEKKIVGEYIDYEEIEQYEDKNPTATHSWGMLAPFHGDCNGFLLPSLTGQGNAAE